MSGKDFYEGGDDSDKYYRPNQATTGDYFVPPPAGATDGKMEEVSLAQQEQLYRGNVEAFGPSHEVYNATPTSFPAPTDEIHAEEIDLHHNEPQPSQPTEKQDYKFYQIEYYQFLFNVDTKEVGWRLLRSLFPYPPNFIDKMRANPDIYGPFWITSTVVFLMFAAGNFGSYLNFVFYGDHTNNNKWSPNFSYVSVSAFAIYGYQFFVPLILWIVSKFLKIGLTLLDCLCIYGYALSIFIPVSIICVAPSNILRWIIVIIAALISTSFLVVNFFP